MAGNKIAVVGSFEFCLGFKLIGIEDIAVVKEKKEFEEALIKYMEDKDMGIIMVEKEMLEQISWRAKRMLKERSFPVVLALSSEEKGEELSGLIKRALGFELKK